MAVEVQHEEGQAGWVDETCYRWSKSVLNPEAIQFDVEQWQLSLSMGGQQSIETLPSRWSEASEAGIYAKPGCRATPWLSCTSAKPPIGCVRFAARLDPFSNLTSSHVLGDLEFLASSLLQESGTDVASIRYVGNRRVEKSHSATELGPPSSTEVSRSFPTNKSCGAEASSIRLDHLHSWPCLRLGNRENVYVRASGAGINLALHESLACRWMPRPDRRHPDFTPGLQNGSTLFPPSPGPQKPSSIKQV